MSYLDLLIDQAKEVTEKQDCSFSGISVASILKSA